ncbi:tRNA (cytidine(34)-2'-O)-methyltransferase [Hydrogenimonas urashimensis]|uniref:tRNA (cytidine(34)-2'-O)-methyltransferase n=1 Tax=Hydrogenimonas urashimensis TaxID=2740515 RepID=UPI001916BA37|nr:tRNA (cytidine(34)-2'-O)-methyltransferase [Hydrogenimonas urashimensis]
MLNIVLVEPKIAPNTGTIGRLCVNMGAKLHLIEPLGFEITDTRLKRAGLDYWHKLAPTIWPSLETFLQTHGDERLWLATTRTDRPWFEADYRPRDWLLFGSETSGLPEALLKRYEERCITIPMTPEGRSLNISIAVGIVAYEAVRQNFKTFKELM